MTLSNSYLHPLVPWHLLIFLLWRFGIVFGQLMDGQFFTPGLIIIDSPSQPTPFSAGSTLPIALDISGDGLLPFPNSFSPTSDTPTTILSLSIFLVSSQTGLNISVADKSILEGEKGSTVKHLNYQIPECIESGSYNLTFYELDRLNNEQFFSIYQIPLTLSSSSNNPSSSDKERCSSSTDNPPPFSIPQDQNPPPKQPFIGNGKPGIDIITTNNNGGGGKTGKATTTATTTTESSGNDYSDDPIVTMTGTKGQSSGFLTVISKMPVQTQTVVKTVTTGNEALTVTIPTVIIESVVVAVPTDSGGNPISMPVSTVAGEFGVPIVSTASTSSGSLYLSLVVIFLMAMLLPLRIIVM